MKIGDLVRHAFLQYPDRITLAGVRVGLVVDIIDKKVFRGPGNKVNWDNIEPEPHGVVLYAHNDGTVDIPVVDLQVINENR